MFRKCCLTSLIAVLAVFANAGLAAAAPKIGYEDAMNTGYYRCLVRPGTG